MPAPADFGWEQAAKVKTLPQIEMHILISARNHFFVEHSHVEASA